MRILSISGSLREGSSNAALLRAAALLAPDGIAWTTFDGLATLPFFNPDLDGDDPPAPVSRLRRDIGSCDALVICSPEYARGISGVLKNALDWLVASSEFPGKPVAVINASQRATHADASLRLILDTMSARLIEPASITLPLLGRGLDAEGILSDPALSALLRDALARIAEAGAMPPRDPSPALPRRDLAGKPAARSTEPERSE